MNRNKKYKMFKNKKRCVISGKLIANNKEAVLTDYVIDYVKKQGYTIIPLLVGMMTIFLFYLLYFSVDNPNIPHIEKDNAVTTIINYSSTTEINNTYYISYPNYLISFFTSTITTGSGVVRANFGQITCSTECYYVECDGSLTDVTYYMQGKSGGTYPILVYNNLTLNEVVIPETNTFEAVFSIGDIYNTTLDFDNGVINISKGDVLNGKFSQTVGTAKSSISTYIRYECDK